MTTPTPATQPDAVSATGGVSGQGNLKLDLTAAEWLNTIYALGLIATLLLPARAPAAPEPAAEPANPLA